MTLLGWICKRCGKPFYLRDFPDGDSLCEEMENHACDEEEYKNRK